MRLSILWKLSNDASGKERIVPESRRTDEERGADQGMRLRGSDAAGWRCCGMAKLRGGEAAGWRSCGVAMLRSGEAAGW